MSLIKSSLFLALQQAKEQEKTTRNTALTKEIAVILNKHFKSKETLKAVSGVIRAKKVKASTPSTLENKAGNTGPWQDWKPGSGAKKQENVTKTTKEVVVDVVDSPKKVEETLAEDNELSIEDLIGLNNQQLIDHFGTYQKVIDYAKDLGLPINLKEDAMENLDSIRIELIELANSVMSDLSEEE